MSELLTGGRPEPEPGPGTSAPRRGHAGTPRWLRWAAAAAAAVAVAVVLVTSPPLGSGRTRAQREPARPCPSIGGPPPAFPGTRGTRTGLRVLLGSTALRELDLDSGRSRRLRLPAGPPGTYVVDAVTVPRGTVLRTARLCVRDGTAPPGSAWFLRTGSDTPVRLGPAAVLVPARSGGEVLLGTGGGPEAAGRSGYRLARYRLDGRRLGAPLPLPPGRIPRRETDAGLLTSVPDASGANRLELYDPFERRVLRRFGHFPLLVSAGAGRVTWADYPCPRAPCPLTSSDLATGGEQSGRTPPAYYPGSDGAASPDGHWVALRIAENLGGVVISNGQAVAVFDTRTGAVRRVPGTFVGPTVGLAVAWSRDSRQLVIAASDGGTRIGVWHPGAARLQAVPGLYQANLASVVLAAR